MVAPLVWAASMAGRAGAYVKKAQGLKRAAKVKGYKAKEALRVGKGKLKYKTAKKFPKTAAGAKRARTGFGAGFSTFAKTKSGKHITKYRGSYAAGATALGYEATKPKKNPYA